MQQVLIHQILLKKPDLAADLKSDQNKIDIDKLKNLLSILSYLKINWDKLDVNKLVTVPVDILKLSHVVKNDVVKNDAFNAKIKNYLILLT